MTAAKGRTKPVVTTSRPVRVALVGVTGSGKSTLLNEVMGERFAVPGGAADTTDKVLELSVGDGLVLYDTPGVGGCEESFEAETLHLVGLPAEGIATRQLCRRNAAEGPCPNRGGDGRDPDAATCRRLGCPSVGELNGERPDLVVELLAGHTGVSRGVLAFHRELARRWEPLVVQSVHALPRAQQRREAERGARARDIEVALQLDALAGAADIPRLLDAIAARVGRDLPWPDRLVPCPQCRGTRNKRCSCGDGARSCARCAGDGWTERLSTCRACDGSGSVDWLFGLFSSPCDQCDGAGWRCRVVGCSACGGTGSVSCSFCRGSGEVDCSFCQGRGEVPRSEAAAAPTKWSRRKGGAAGGR